MDQSSHDWKGGADVETHRTLVTGTPGWTRPASLVIRYRQDLTRS